MNSCGKTTSYDILMYSMINYALCAYFISRYAFLNMLTWIKNSGFSFFNIYTVKVSWMNTIAGAFNLNIESNNYISGQNYEVCSCFIGCNLCSLFGLI